MEGVVRESRGALRSDGALWIGGVILVVFIKRESRGGGGHDKEGCAGCKSNSFECGAGEEGGKEWMSF